MTEFDKVIPPGGVGKVTASLDTSHYKGVISKSVQVRSKDTGTPPVALVLKVEIVTVIDVAPTEAPTLRTSTAERKPVELTVSAADGKPFDVLAVEADAQLQVTVRGDGPPPPTRKAKRSQPRPIAAGKSRYLVTIAPTEQAPLGQSIANVKLTTNRPSAENVPIRVLLMMTGPVDVVPPRLALRAGAEPLVVHVRLSKPSGGALKILGVTSADPEFTATATPIKEGREYDVAVSYTGKPGRGFVNSRITVKTNEPTQGTIVIPFAGRI